MKIQNTNQNFSGIKIASASAKLNGVVSNYELYKITPKDSVYLDNLESKINLTELWHGLKSEDYSFWNKILKMMLGTAKSNYMETILITQNGIPCGGLNYKMNSHNRCNIGYRVTWPLERDKKAPFAGKILYMQLFKKCLEDGITSIRTAVTRTGPFSAVDKSLQLGFCLNGGDDYNELMGIGQKGMKNTLEKFRDIIEIIPVAESERKDVALSEILQSEM